MNTYLNTYCDDLFKVVCYCVYVCVFHVQDDIVISHTGTNKVFCIL